MRRLRIGILDLVTKSPNPSLYGRIMNANLASIMPQVIGVWCEQAGHEVGAEVADVRIDPAQEVTVADEQRLPHRVALPAPGRKLGQELGDGEDARSFGAGGVAGRVRRAVVHDHDLVDELEVLDEASAHRRDYAADGGFFVTRGKAHRDRVPVACFRLHERGEEPRFPRPPHAPQITQGSQVALAKLQGCSTFSPVRAHQERLRDRPNEAAATSVKSK